jgi:hypothetical protein
MYTNLPPFEKDTFNRNETLIHHVSQFLAMAGKNYLPDEPDDSNTNLGLEDGRITSRVIQADEPFQVAIELRQWLLCIINITGGIVTSIAITGKTRSELFHWLKNKFNERGLDGDQLKYIDHYEIPGYPTEDQQPHESIDNDAAELWTLMRNNAVVLMNELNDLINIQSEIRIWPHHFDTGVYYPLSDDKAIGAGWAMADGLVDNPYLYIYGWKKDEQLDYSGIPSTTIGSWIIREGWEGFTISAEQIAASTNQYEDIIDSIKTSLKFYKRLSLN